MAPVLLRSLGLLAAEKTPELHPSYTADRMELKGVALHLQMFYHRE
jgi:hypothetical protein